MQFFKSDLNIDFMGVQKWAILGSTIIIVIGIVSLVVKGGPKYGIDFSGGTLVQVKFFKDKADVDVDRIRETLKNLNLSESLIQQYGVSEENEFLIRMSQSSSALKSISDEIKQVLIEEFGAESFEVRRVEMVGPKVGKDLRQKGLWAIIFATILVLIYTGWRFEFKYGIGAIAALAHDVMITVGAFSLTNREISLPVIAALLTIIGYSLNDTIVVFDRVRDNLRIMKGENYENIFNKSINQTLSRTILTSLTTFFVVVALFVLGGEVINDFAFALILGVIIGTYSSIYIASPAVLIFNKLFAHQVEPEKGRAKSSNASVAAAQRSASLAASGELQRIKQREAAQSNQKKGKKGKGNRTRKVKG
ncbi:MAG: protein translocase subunit SecF [bacterium]